jgi:hypothetical protein
MNQKQLDKIEEDYPIGSLVRIAATAGWNHIYGIVVGYDLNPLGSELWIWIHNSVGVKQHWNYKNLKVIARP